MIRSLPRSRAYDRAFVVFILLYFIFLFAPLLVTCVLAFNNSDFPSLPWRGFTLDWFLSAGPKRVGIFEDADNLRAIWVSFKTALWVSASCVVVGVCAAFLFEQENFKGKNFLYFLMLAPLVIPGVILGISILLGATTAGIYFEDHWNLDIELFRPSFRSEEPRLNSSHT